ncbi:hypothetical protein HMN09_00990500 [Mycena chlorophos]|uniref:Uncharacterized protein n=1 Tax=Mycena chlorophos TaxID=658473 RepID=A0A8H6W1S7_MYCCL|nr:hypothetical protein HMN09_00990500 [Mycena chlorophos]
MQLGLRDRLQRDYPSLFQREDTVDIYIADGWEPLLRRLCAALAAGVTVNPRPELISPGTRTGSASGTSESARKLALLAPLRSAAQTIRARRRLTRTGAQATSSANREDRKQTNVVPQLEPNPNPQAELRPAPPMDIAFSEIKEKFAGLYVYTAGASAASRQILWSILSDVRAESRTICEDCGEENGGRLAMIGGHGRTLCQECLTLKNADREGPPMGRWYRWRAEVFDEDDADIAWPL